MREQSLLDFPGIDVVSTGDDHVGEPVFEVEEPVLVEDADITGVNPTAGDEGGLVEFGRVEVFHVRLCVMRWNRLLSEDVGVPQRR
ncbi:hypothetical protein ACFXPS_44310 [Nocardia sp. NPDC059091]|uniref:hypothetical protein n=1 Tax=Nocardia sp. NPDC059091 TaxID=3346724 RepID=UPI0036793A0E